MMASMFMLCVMRCGASDGMSCASYGVVGKTPLRLAWYIKLFSRASDEQNSSFLNRMILHGPPGNGKSMWARVFAQATQSEFIARSACSMVERYVGQGAMNVVQLFATARELVETSDKKVVIFIDEIDALAASNGSEFRAEHKAALQQLWLELDACKWDKRIFVLFATNEFKKLSTTFLDRFGCNTVEIRNPNKRMRSDLLKHYCAQVKMELTDGLLAALVQKTEGLSIRSLEDLVHALRMEADLKCNGQVTAALVEKNLIKVKKKFKGNVADEEKDRESQLQRTTNIVSIVTGLLSAALNLHLVWLLVTTGTTVPSIQKRFLHGAVD
jgi:SpoVK/Ycf46/Vps4 family AAA+-type ATPase